MNKIKFYERFITPIFVSFSLLAIVLIQYWGYEKPLLGIDDANIYFVYMKNVANGFGFVWNVGDERVEGFTSLLWTLIGACMYKISPAHFSLILAGLLFVLTSSTITITLRLIHRLNKSTATIVYTDLIVLSLLLLPLGFVEWNILSLMETGLWTFLLTSMVVLLCNIYLNKKKVNYFFLVSLIILIDLTRPESILYNVIFISILFIINCSFTGWKKSLYKCILPISVHLVTILLIIQWRLSYFGYAFPNTYYAKVSNSIKDNAIAGINYAFVFFYNYPVNIFIVLVLLYFTASILLRYKRKIILEPEEKVHLVLMMFILFTFFMPMITGGDHFKYNRFYQMLPPLFFAAICNVYCWNNYIRITIPPGRIEKGFLMFSLMGMVFFSAKYTIFDFIASQRRILHYPVIQDFIVSRSGREVAEKMNETFSSLNKYPAVGTLATGGFAFVYKGKTIDLMGLNNTMMAHANPYKVGYRNHASFDKVVFYKLKPDMMGTFYGAEVINDTTGFILPENKPEFRTDYANMVYGSFKQIYDDDDFRNMYYPALLYRPGKEFFIFDYCSKNFLSSLDTTVIKVKILERNLLSDKFRHASQQPARKLGMNRQ